jgi:signal transduction histidine kinase
MSSAAGVQTAAARAQARTTDAMALQAIAHELRQPLSAIESIAYYLNLVLPPGDRRSREQVSRLQVLVEQSNWILTSGMQLISETPVSPESVDLEELITQSIAARATHRDSRFELQLAGGLPLVQLDPGSGRAWIENLLSLFESLPERCPVHLATSRCDTRVALTLTARVRGFRSEASLGPGSGLSLAAARHVVEAHHGTLELQVDPTSGIVLTVVLP